MERQTLKLVCNEFISVNHYLGYRVVGKHVVAYKKPEAKKFQKEFEKYIKEQIELQGWKPSDNPYQHYYVDSVYYMPRLDTDPSNYTKCNHDSMTDAGVWLDDNMTCERVLKVMYDSKNPRIEYTIYKTDFIGIFDNEEQLNDFEDKCKTCKRYSNNCSILRKAKEGRVQEEINELVCSKYKEK